MSRHRKQRISSSIKVFLASFALATTSLPTGLFGTNEAYIYAPKELGNIFENTLKQGLKLSPFDDLVRKHSTKNEVDWRLISSIIYAESRFQYDAQSPAGAKGLMQLMPIAAKQHGTSNVFVPEENIRSGISHFLWGKNRLIGQTKDDELNLALAAYNAGLGHVRDAQILAKKLGKNHRTWKGVAPMLLLLEHPQYYSKSRYGYCKGTETVQYVSRVRSQYEVYKESYPLKPEAFVQSLIKSARQDV